MQDVLTFVKWLMFKKRQAQPLFRCLRAGLSYPCLPTGTTALPGAGVAPERLEPPGQGRVIRDREIQPEQLGQRP